MPATLSRIVLDGSGNVMMIVLPDTDEQLKDPAFAPAGTVQVDVSGRDYAAAFNERDDLALAKTFLDAKHPDIAVKVAAKIKQIDDAKAAYEAALALEAAQADAAAQPADVAP